MPVQKGAIAISLFTVAHSCNFRASLNNNTRATLHSSLVMSELALHNPKISHLFQWVDWFAAIILGRRSVATGQRKMSMDQVYRLLENNKGWLD